ncbi:MAG: hypothetical protein HXS41_06015 [Theionarchaea archaeon]|nr:hypothetical protein [Theionarchaea archaeon]MBU7001105.1 hypothetical protein [Theionarchaea archaeon]MBU7020594.1 hypothetical protein [Theionarchaea archaeon]MBU7034243.1 hypothetical protein [Theionarchaea archaeon]MBU7039317.1 hypothetical protein [Theionarchaea archaeon]
MHNIQVPAGAVRVWRGYKRKEVELREFFQKSGSVFVPAAVEMERQLGMHVYVPAFPAGIEKPGTVPDETAILFWESQKTYHDAFKTLAERIYVLTHGPLFGPPSTADFPEYLGKTFEAEKPYYLYDTPADWMHGVVTHLVGGRPEDQTPKEFLSHIEAWAHHQQNRKPEGLDGAIICAGTDYVVYWEHWVALEGRNSSIRDLAELAVLILLKDATPVSLPAGLWDDWEGLTITSGDCLNLQFKRRSPFHGG